MAAGEAWIFDNWRRHHVENNSASERIHLVADTTGTAAFWRFACGEAPPRETWRTVRWAQDAHPQLLTECEQRSPVMPPAEVQWLIDDLRGELTGSGVSADAGSRAARLDLLLQEFVRDWRQLCALHGVSGRALPDFAHLVRAVREAATALADGVVMRTNGASAMLVLEKRVLQHLLADASGSHAGLRRAAG